MCGLVLWEIIANLWQDQRVAIQKDNWLIGILWHECHMPATILDHNPDNSSPEG
jgi:hypothetical protein